MLTETQVFLCGIDTGYAVATLLPRTCVRATADRLHCLQLCAEAGSRLLDSTAGQTTEPCQKQPVHVAASVIHSAIASVTAHSLASIGT